MAFAWVVKELEDRGVGAVSLILGSRPHFQESVGVSFSPPKLRDTPEFRDNGLG